MIPPILVRPVMYVSIGLAIAAAGFAVGGLYVSGKWRDAEARRATEAVKIITRQGEVTERVVTRWLERQAAGQVVTETIEREVTKYVESKPLALACLLDVRWMRLHDAAAAGQVPPPAGAADAAPGTITAAAALPVVTGNYATCGRNAERLEALQRWVRGQYETTNMEPLRWPP